MRTGDAMIVSDPPASEVPCADLLLLILEHIVAGTCLPLIGRLPPDRGRAPDALIHYGGDDESQDDLQAWMSDLMAGMGLPYHINVMADDDYRFHFSDEDRAIYEKNGHEISLHFDFVNKPAGVQHPCPIPEAEYERQLDNFIERFGFTPVCANTHYLRESGWADMARFGARRGILGLNSQVHYRLPPMDPVNLFGTPFGTVYPHFVYEDPERGHERLEFVTLPISFYEPGARTEEWQHPFCGQDPYRPDEYRRVTDLACAYGWTVNVFLHPCHVANAASRGRDAVQCMLDRIAEQDRHVVHVGNDALCLWWHARRASAITPSGDRSYTVKATHERGLVMRFPAASVTDAVIEVDGTSVQPRIIERAGRAWACIVVPQGEHRVVAGTVSTGL